MLVTAWTRRVRRMTLSGMTSRGGSPLCAGRQGPLPRPNHCSPSLVQLRLPDDVVHAVHQRPARANIVKRTTSLPPKHAAEVNVQMNKNLARLKIFSMRPSSRHAPTLRRLERDVVSAELGLAEIIAPRRDSSTPTTSSSHSSVMAVISASTSK